VTQSRDIPNPQGRLGQQSEHHRRILSWKKAARANASSPRLWPQPGRPLACAAVTRNM